MAELRTFPSKVDTWLVLVLVVAGAMATVSAVIGIQHGVFAGVLADAVFFAVMAGLVWPTRYEVLEDTLVVRFGLMRRTFRLDAIRAVTPSNDPRSSPALSLQRLRVTTDESSILISPADREGFYGALLERTRLHREGAGLAR